ncbi:MAG: hypothetical protein Q9172_002950 [Xanthocarpia lactea]
MNILPELVVFLTFLESAHAQNPPMNVVTQIAPFPQQQIPTIAEAPGTTPPIETLVPSGIDRVFSQPVGIAPWNTLATPTLTTVVTISGQPETVTVGPFDEPIPLLTVTQDNGGVYACVETIYIAVDPETACIEGWTQTIVTPESGPMTPFGEAPDIPSTSRGPDIQALTTSVQDGVITSPEPTSMVSASPGGNLGSPGPTVTPTTSQGSTLGSSGSTITTSATQTTGAPDIFADPSNLQTVITESGITGTYSLSIISEYGTLTGTNTVTTQYPVTQTVGSISETIIPIIIGPGGVRWTPVCNGILCPGGGGGGGGGGGITPPCLGFLCGGGGGGGGINPSDPIDPEDPDAPDDPDDPENPDDPDEPVDPEDPDDPDAPEDPNDPDDPEDPNDPDDPEESATGTSSTQPPSSTQVSSSTTSSSSNSACVLPSTIWPLPSYIVEEASGTGTLSSSTEFVSSVVSSTDGANSSDIGSSSASACVLPSTIWPLPSYTIEDLTGTVTSGFVTSTTPKASQTPSITSKPPEPTSTTPPNGEGSIAPLSDCTLVHICAGEPFPTVAFSTLTPPEPTTEPPSEEPPSEEPPSEEPPPPPPKPSEAIIIYRYEFCSEIDCFSSVHIYEITPGEPVDPCSDRADYTETFALDATDIDLGPFSAWGYDNLNYRGTSTEVGLLEGVGAVEGESVSLFGIPCIVPAAERDECGIGSTDDMEPIVYYLDCVQIFDAILVGAEWYSLIFVDEGGHVSFLVGMIYLFNDLVARGL